RCSYCDSMAHDRIWLLGLRWTPRSGYAGRAFQRRHGWNIPDARWNYGLSVRLRAKLPRRRAQMFMGQSDDPTVASKQRAPEPIGWLLWRATRYERMDAAHQ